MHLRAVIFMPAFAGAVIFGFVFVLFLPMARLGEANAGGTGITRRPETAAACGPSSSNQNRSTVTLR